MAAGAAAPPAWSGRRVGVERRERQTGTGERSPPPAYPGNLAGHPVQTGPLPRSFAHPPRARPSALGWPRPRPERTGLRCSRRGLHPARRCCCGRRREAGGAARAERGAPCVRLCGAEEAGPAGTRAATRRLPGSGRGPGWAPPPPPPPPRSAA